jgi:hypothetical protein
MFPRGYNLPFGEFIPENAVSDDYGHGEAIGDAPVEYKQRYVSHFQEDRFHLSPVLAVTRWLGGATRVYYSHQTPDLT